MAVLLLGFGESLDVGQRRVLLQTPVQLLQPLGRAVESAPREDVRQRRLRRFGAGPRVLRDVAKRPAAEDQAGGRIVLGREHLQEAGLARAVAAD